MSVNPIGRVITAGAGVVTALCATYAGYLTVIGIAAGSSLRNDGHLNSASRSATRFRIVIPAHNEEALIKDTIGAIGGLAYPKDQMEVHVVADNCTDRTSEIAQDAGATVHKRTDPANPGKGPALSWILSRLVPDEPDGVPEHVIVIIDADTIVEPNLLVALSERFETGTAAVQGYYAVRGHTEGGEVSLRSAAFAVRHLIRPAGRVHLGGSSSLYGNGMAFTEDIARRFPWSPHLTEDLDMGLRLLLAGETVDFAPGAVVRGEMPDSLDGATSQHERWETGRRTIARSYVPRLLQAARRGDHGRRWAYVDAALDISMPPLGTLVASATTASALFAGLTKGKVRLVGAGSGAASVGLLIVHVLGSLRLSDAPSSVYRSLLRAPHTIVWKIALQLRTRRQTPDAWVRTSRNDTQ